MSFASRGGQESTPGFISQTRLCVPLDVWLKMMTFMKVCDVEVNGFGYVDREEFGFLLEDVFILEQEADLGYVVTEAQAIHRHLFELVSQGGDSGRMRFQWHSHVDMPVYFSPVDIAKIEKCGGDWTLSLVGNKRGEFQARLDVFKPFRAWTPIEVKVLIPDDEAMTALCRAEVKQKVKAHSGRTLRFKRENQAPRPGQLMLDPSSLLLGI